MANLLDIKRRIRSVKNTQQITKAMKMVAAAKLRRSQDRILDTRPYALELAKVTSKLARAARHPEAGDELEESAPDPASEVEPFGEDEDAPGPEDAPDGPPEQAEAHPLLQVRREGKVLLAVVTGDRGLAGSFNASVLRRAQQAIGRWKDVDLELLLLGKKGADYFGRRSTPVRRAHRDLFSEVTYERAREIASDVTEAYSAGEYDAVYVIYNQFKSVMQQELTEERLLPIPVEGAEEEAAEHLEIGVPGGSYIYEPSPEAILHEILPRYVDFQVYRVLLESQAAEHAARMTAMDSATKNAGEMIDKLTLSYNRARQAEITTELIEVVSGANALEG